MLLSISLLVITGRSFGAEMSLRCLYVVITEGYESSVLCGEPITASRQEQYIISRALLRNFIDGNARDGSNQTAIGSRQTAPDFDQMVRRMRKFSFFALQSDFPQSNYAGTGRAITP
jgi:hypothetical protein